MTSIPSSGVLELFGNVRLSDGTGILWVTGKGNSKIIVGMNQKYQGGGLKSLH